MGQHYRLLAIDVDGTLLDSHSELPVAHRLALHRAHEAGLIVSLCTGRSLTETRAVIEALGLDSDIGIFVFGAVITELPSGRTIQSTPLDHRVAQRLIEHFQSRGYPVLVLYDAAEAGIDYHLVRGERNQATFERWVAMSPASCERVDAWRADGYPPIRIGIIDDPEHIEETVTLLGREFTPREIKFNPIYAPNYGLHVVECFAPVVNKWYGISQVAERLGIDRSKIVAIGDDVNDREMVAEAGLGIAMGNAAESIKAVARWVAPSHDVGGLAVAVDAVLSGKLH